MEKNPASEILQHPSSSGQSRRARKRQKSRLSRMVQIGDINAKGFVFGTEVSCDLTLKYKIGENWPKNQVLAQKCPENAPSILMEEIKSVNVGVDFSLDWCALTELRKILAKLALRHSTAPYKYIAWHYASKVGNRRKTRSKNSNSIPELEEAYLHNNSNEESRPLACEKDRLMLLLEYSNQCGGERGNNSGGPQRNNMHESIHPNIILLFLLSSIRHTVPDDIFGSHANKKIFIKQWLPILYEFRGRKSVALGKLMNGVAVSKVHWAREVGSIGGRGKRAYIVSKVWLWLLTQYLACLVSCHFVLVKVSGGNGNGMQEAFFAKRIWQSWTESTVAAHTSPEGIHPKAPLKGWVLTPVPADEKLAIHQSGRCLISNLQFRVKRHGVRPVMKVRFSPEEYTLKKACQALLRYLMNDNAYNDPITRLSITWKKFHSMWKELSMTEKEAQKEQPFTYAVKVDIEDAYGSVIHEKIYDILLEKLEKAGLKNDCKVSIKAIKCFKKLPNGKYVYKERHHLEGINIKSASGQSESSSEWTVKWRKSFQIGCLLSFLKKCISEQFVRDRRQLYHLTQGLVQGSIFSPLLWEIYLHNLVEKHLLPHFSDGPSELICGVDDILFLTGSQEKAEWFLRQMCEGFLAYNVYINPRKISTNLKGRTESEFITFWGFTLDPVTGYAIGHFAGHPGRDLSNTIKLSVLKDPWRLLKSTLLFGNTKLCFLTMNPDYNGKRIVLCNVFRAALLLAARFHAIAKVVLKNLGLHVRVFKRGNISASFENNIPDCPANVVQPCTSHGIGAKGITKFSNNQILLIAFIKKRVKFLIQCVEKLERKHCLENIQTTDEIKWLSYTAFRIILGKSGGYYPEVLKRINLLRKGVAKQIQGEKITELQNIASLCQI